MGTVHQLPVKHNEKVNALGENVSPEEELARAVRRAVNAKVGEEATFAQREAAALALTNEATRLYMKEDLEAIADSHGEEVEVNGVVYKRHLPGTAQYDSLCGNMDIERWTYRQMGVHNGPTIVPMELEAGMVERATPALAFRVALGYAKDPMRSCEEDMKGDHRRPPSRSTLERMAKCIGAEAQRAAPRIEPHLRRSEKVPEQAVAVSLGLDRTSVPMEEGLTPGEEPSTRRKPRRKPYLRAIPERVEVNYRMAYVGTMAFHDADGEALATRRYAVGADTSPQQILDRLMADLRNALRRSPQLAVGLVQDGAPELWKLLREAIAKESVVKKVHEAIDRYHLNERLGEVLRFIQPDAARRKEQLSRWNDSLDSNDKAIYRIREWVREQHQAAAVANDEVLFEKLAPHMVYLDNNASLMRYAELRKTGLPVGSGVTEGACKSVIEVRTNGSGQRWRPDGLQPVLTLRSVHMSERLPRFWAHLSRRYTAEIRKCA